MSLVDRIKEVKRKWILSVIFIVIVLGGIIFLLFQNINESNRLRKKQAEELQEKIELLNSTLNDLSQSNRQLKKSRDSLQRNVTYMWPMRSLVYNAKLRDRVADGMDFKPGQAVRVKADSSIVVITEYVVGGNAYNYYVHFRARNRKGDFQEFSPYEIEAVPAR